MTVQDYISKISRLIDDIDDKVSDIVNDNEKEILDLNRIDQLYNQGIDNEGKSLVPDYRPLTLELKFLKNQPTDRVTLKDTGAFYDGFKIKELQQDRYAIFSTDEKSTDLVDKYGNIFGLTNENAVKVNKIITNELHEYIKNYLE